MQADKSIPFTRLLLLPITDAPDKTLKLISGKVKEVKGSVDYFSV